MGTPVTAALTLDEAIDELRRDPGRTVRARLGELTVEMHCVPSGDAEDTERILAALVQRGLVTPPAVVDTTRPPRMPVAPLSEVMIDLLRDRESR